MSYNKRMVFQVRMVIRKDQTIELKSAFLIRFRLVVEALTAVSWIVRATGVTEITNAHIGPRNRFARNRTNHNAGNPPGVPGRLFHCWVSNLGFAGFPVRFNINLHISFLVRLRSGRDVPGLCHRKNTGKHKGNNGKDCNDTQSTVLPGFLFQPLQANQQAVGILKQTQKSHSGPNGPIQQPPSSLHNGLAIIHCLFPQYPRYGRIAAKLP